MSFLDSLIDQDASLEGLQHLAADPDCTVLASQDYRDKNDLGSSLHLVSLSSCCFVITNLPFSFLVK
jgi:hypothetical protein